MTFRTYLDKHYQDACNAQRKIAGDMPLVKMLRQGTADVEIVKSWMQNYGLFQGIADGDRKKICKSFLKFAGSHKKRKQLSDDDIGEVYRELFSILYRVLPRAWTSASSKLLWCLYPSDIVIYDTFVHRSMVVLQRIDPDLVGFNRIGNAPKIYSIDDIEQTTVHYVNYQRMVKRLCEVHKKRLGQLRKKYREEYRYDIRIVDKLLWMIGNPIGEWKV